MSQTIDILISMLQLKNTWGLTSFEYVANHQNHEQVSNTNLLKSNIVSKTNTEFTNEVRTMYLGVIERARTTHTQKVQT